MKSTINLFSKNNAKIHLLTFIAILGSLGLVNFNVLALGDLEESELEPKNTFVVSFGYTHIPKGAELDAEESDGFFVPSIGLDYARVVGRKWEVGVMLDFELDHYLIVEKELERENAFIGVVGVAYNPIAHLLLFTGAGVEIEKNKHLFVYRLGLDYSFYFGHHWAIVPAFYFDWKEDYDTYAFSVGAKYRF